MKVVREKAGITNTPTWRKFVSAFSPTNAFEMVGTDLKLWSADDYYNILLNAVKAAGALYDEVATEDQFEEVLEAAEQAGMATDFKDAAATGELIKQQQTFAEGLAEGFWYDY